MSLTSLVSKVRNASLSEELINRTNRQERLEIQGAGRVAKSIISTALSKSEKRPLLLLVSNLEEAARWLSLLESCGWSKSYLYPTSEASPYDAQDLSTEHIWGQLQVLSELMLAESFDDIAVVATERSLQPHLPNRIDLESNCIKIHNNQQLDVQELSEKLTKIGYTREATTYQEGTWSRRGDIIDIYPVNNEVPIRLELFGDQVDKIRELDPSTQRSLDIIDEIYLTPTSYNKIISESLVNSNEKGLEKIIGQKRLEQLIENSFTSNISNLLGYAYKKPSSILDYLPKHTCVIFDERSNCLSHGEKWFDHVQEHYDSLRSFYDLDKQEFRIFFPGNLHINIAESFEQVSTYFGFDLKEIFQENSRKNIFDASCRTFPSYPNQFGKVSQQVQNNTKEKNSTWILSAQPTRTVALLEEHECITKFVSNSEDINGILCLIDQKTPVVLKATGTAEIEGVFLAPWKIVLITDREIYGQQRITSTAYIRRRSKSNSKIVNPSKMIEGDYIVHRNHGIGCFLKIEKLAFGGQIRDYLVIKYLDGILRVAADQLTSLTRYRSSSETKPSLNKMGGASWEKLKAKAKKSIQKIAFDLVKLYAERSEAKGFPYPNDGPWQEELEGSFPYEPTPDQLKAVKDVKQDMQKSQPMDRLICGDVGFGKTEVAVRAIFKAITAGKQIALLAPTTVLAQQHWRTISDRFAPYPIKISLLNRFRTKLEREKIIKGLKEGNIDAVIGTHQLLNKKIEYKDLGLLVVDEEQRFGVSQKEKIKVIKKNIDVLTLSATPIPRTLYMSLSGVREMSLITTPPPQRRAIKTHLSEFDEEAVRSAISQELDRGGQIFYVVPRVDGIENVAKKIITMVPNIKLVTAHGQMPEGQLESTMVAFNAGEADLMLCTTIIESGLDIPRVNTIIVEDSQKFGLSQLYQLRGRVGRSGIQAHAWLFYPSNSLLTDTARKRLRAIQEFAQLGSGYQLAIRDMEIRGVGNLLGVEQSGQMETIGFDLYMEMLQEALAEIQGQDLPTVDDTQIDLPVTAFIPAEWITDKEEKISAYRLASDCKTSESIIDVAASWTDRYGNIPKPVESLLRLMQLKLLAKSCAFTRIYLEKPNVILETPMEEPAFLKLRKGLPKHLHGRLIFKKGTGINSTVTVRGIGVLPVDKLIEQLMEWFRDMLENLHNLEKPDSANSTVKTENKKS